MQFDADAFISYAHVDNQELVEGRKGWVANLHRALEIRVGQLLGKHPQIWRDPKLQGNDVFPETLKDRLGHVAALIAVVSPRYIRSEWTLRELHEFCRAAQDQGGIQLRQKSRIFKVLKTPVPEPSHPPELRTLLGYEFFKRDPETGKIRELNDVFGDSAQREFWMRLDDLAHELSALLSELDEEGSEAKPAPFSVYLAETTSDLREQRETLRRDLQRHGYRILPAVPLPYVAADVASAVRADLADCRLSIHLFGSTYGLVPEGGGQSLLEQQNELAIERAAAGSFCRLLWIPPNVAIADDRQRAVIEHLRNDPRLEEGADLLETYLEDFRTLVHERLEAAAAPKVEEERPAAAVPVATAGRIRSVYAIYEERDASLAAPWVDYLFDQRLEVLNPVFEGDEADVREYTEENIRTCNGVLIFYGSTNEVWIRRKLRELQKSAGYGRLKPPPTVAICVLPPDTPEKERFRTHEASVIRFAGAFDAGQLEPFLKELRSRPG